MSDGDRPNILVIWGDDIGITNLSCYSDGLMGYRTPNIDRIAAEGMRFTDSYGEQSCTAGRSSFITGQSVFRTGLSKVGIPAAPLGLRAEDPTIAELLKPLGYATGQFGKNHLGDRNEFLPTVHGFDEFFGNLYHLNAEEDPESPNYPPPADFPHFQERFGPRGVLHSWATEEDDATEQPRWGRVGRQRIEDTGPLTRKRMETVDDEILEHALGFIDRQHQAGTPSCSTCAPTPSSGPTSPPTPTGTGWQTTASWSCRLRRWSASSSRPSRSSRHARRRPASPSTRRSPSSRPPSPAASRSRTMAAAQQAEPSSQPGPGMVWIPGGTFLMGSDHHYPEEAPAHEVTVDGFWIDRYTVTNAEFARFVRKTGHLTVAERAPDPADYPGARPELLVPASTVFRQPPHRVDLANHYNWWTYVPGASWRRPQGPGSSIRKKPDHPVVHVAWDDVQAYAAWADKELPTEAEWELACRGGLDGAEYAWGEELNPGGRWMANTWQGEFPVRNTREDGYEGTAPVGSYPSNGYGLHDMIGNVWEWTNDWYQAHAEASHACCTPANPRGGEREQSHDPRDAAAIPRRVMKGGSHLCAPNYCRRYRPAARMAQPVDTGTSHLGFRCIVRGR